MLTSPVKVSIVDAMSRILAVGLLIQLLAVPSVHRLVDCQAHSHDQQACAHGHCGDAPAPLASTVHYDADTGDDAAACHCPCHARTLPADGQVPGELALMARRAPERPPPGPQERTERPPTPPPQA